MKNAACDEIPGRFSLVFYFFLATAASRLFVFYNRAVTTWRGSRCNQQSYGKHYQRTKEEYFFFNLHSGKFFRSNEFNLKKLQLSLVKC